MTDNIFMAILSKIKKINTQITNVNQSVADVKSSLPTDYATQSSVDEIKSVVDVIVENSSSDSPAVHGTAEFTTAGTHTWTCPEGVTSVVVFLASAGGGGGSGSGGNNGDPATAGSGGAAGNVVVVKLEVSPGTVYNITVGSGGNGGASATYGKAGSAGSVGGSTIFDNITVLGGLGGKGGTTTVNSTVAGGSARSSNTVAQNIPYTVEVITILLGSAGSASVKGGTYGAGGAVGYTTEGYAGFPSSAGGDGTNSAWANTAVGGKGKDGKVVIMW